MTRAKMPSPPFVLPKEPVDGFEVRWFRVNSTLDIPSVCERSARYYVNTRYEDAFPDGMRGGAALVDDWMVFENGRSSGRWCSGHDYTGWESASRPGEWWANTFATKEEACARAAAICRERIEYRESQIAELRGALVRFTYNGDGE